MVFADYKDGHVSAEMAESAFGVVIIGGMIDDDATKAKRSQLKEARQYFAVEFSDAITENQSRRRCGLISKAMCRLGIQDGDLVEVIALVVRLASPPKRLLVKMSKGSSLATSSVNFKNC